MVKYNFFFFFFFSLSTPFKVINIPFVGFRAGVFLGLWRASVPRCIGKLHLLPASNCSLSIGSHNRRFLYSVTSLLLKFNANTLSLISPNSSCCLWCASGMNQKGISFNERTRACFILFSFWVAHARHLYRLQHQILMSAHLNCTQDSFHIQFRGMAK